MFDHHRKSPWFAEKYDPALELQNLRTRVRKDGWKGRLGTFLVDLENGKFDPDLNEPETESTASVKEIANTQSVSGDANGTSHSATTEETKPVAGDDDMQFNIDADDDAADNDANRQDANGKVSQDPRRANRGEEVSVLPDGNQVMIRTIPPDIGRVKLEEVSVSMIIVRPVFNVHIGLRENTWLYVPCTW